MTIEEREELFPKAKDFIWEISKINVWELDDDGQTCIEDIKDLVIGREYVNCNEVEELVFKFSLHHTAPHVASRILKLSDEHGVKI